VGLYYRDLSGPDSLAIDADARFHAASTMKVPVMIQVFREVDARRLRLNDRVPVVNTFRSIADSTSYSLDKADDSDSSLYDRVGQSLPVRDLVELMITVSSNLATNILIDRVRADSVRAALHDIGADSVTVLRGVEDNAAYRAGMNNTTTARGLGVVMAAIADGRAASAAACGEMVHILRRQRFNAAIPAGLPRGVAAAHKTGWLTGVHHDAAIVYWKDRPRYVLVVLTRGIQEEAQSAALIAELTAMVNAHALPESLR
jgi:beta-lactamase class A